MPKPCAATRIVFSRLVDKVERQDAFDTGAMDLLWPGPLKIGHRLEAADPRIFEAAFDALARPGVEFGADERSRRTTGLQRFCVARAMRSLTSVGGLGEAQLPEVITQGRRDRIG